MGGQIVNTGDRGRLISCVIELVLIVLWGFCLRFDFEDCDNLGSILGFGLLGILYDDLQLICWVLLGCLFGLADPWVLGGRTCQTDRCYWNLSARGKQPLIISSLFGRPLSIGLCSHFRSFPKRSNFGFMPSHSCSFFNKVLGGLCQRTTELCYQASRWQELRCGAVALGLDFCLIVTFLFLEACHFAILCLHTQCQWMEEFIKAWVRPCLLASSVFVFAWDCISWGSTWCQVFGVWLHLSPYFRSNSPRRTVCRSVAINSVEKEFRSWSKLTWGRFFCYALISGQVLVMSSDQHIGTKSSVRSTPKQFKSCLHRLFYWLCLMLCCRVGEAAVPGPQSNLFTIGVCNPGGLGSKAHLFDAQDGADVWLVSETHLSAVGLRSFRKSLAIHKSSYKWIVHGHPVQPRSVVSDIGQWTGVACISKHPSRALVTDWDDGLSFTSRIVGSATFCGSTWVQGVTVYGTPVGPSHPTAKQTTECLLDVAITRVVQAVGCRFLAGDWNGDHNKLQGVAKLRALGFQDIQDLEFLRSGQCPLPTCRGRTRRDFLFVSPELALRFRGCKVDPLAWADHASLIASFDGDPSASVRSVWPIPIPCDWSLADPNFLNPVCRFQSNDLDKEYRSFWEGKEKQVQKLAQVKGTVVSPLAFGRGARNQPLVSNVPSPPLKKGRGGDLQPKFFGFSMLHLQWFRQLRRLRHFLRLVEASVSSHSQALHASKLWESILKAPGFKPSFAMWWGTRGRALGEVAVIPLQPPNAQDASLIFAAFEFEVRHLECTLRKHRNYVARLRHSSDVNQLFKTVKRDPPCQVDVLIKEAVGIVSEVDPSDASVTFQDMSPWVDSLPVFHQQKPCAVIHAEPDKVWLDGLPDIQVGDVVVQPQSKGERAEVFAAFREQWNQRWNRHDGVPDDRWRVIREFAAAELTGVSFNHLVVEPSLLSATVRSKKKHAATGLDGVCRQDLLSCQPNDLQSLCCLFRRAEATGQWPQQVLNGSIKSLAKISNPSTPNHFRPVTIFSLVYRAWSSAQSRYLLSALDPVLSPLLLGNRKGKKASDMWHFVLDAVDQSYADGSALSGLILDLEKAYNTLPRVVSLETLKRLGVPQEVLVAWAGALAGFQRFFQVQGHVSEGLGSCTGFPEGCGLSCLAMVGIDMLYHCWMTRAMVGVQAVSYVDNWELLMDDPSRATEAFQQCLIFCELLDLSLDAQKTVAWSTDSDSRGLLRQGGFTVVEGVRDLGAHLVYTRQIRNATVQERIAGLSDFWSKLSCTFGSRALKSRVVRCAAWPRALHGISSCYLGRKHWEGLRSDYMRSMHSQKPGVSPVLQMLLDGLETDPLAFGVKSTIRDFRDLGSSDRHLALIWRYHLGEVDLPPSSVTAVLTSRLALLGWTWSGEGIVTDQVGALSLVTCGMAELNFRFALGWEQWVITQCKHRLTFAQFGQVDVAATMRHLRKLSLSEVATLRAYQNGMSFTNEHAFRWSEDGCVQCPLCNHPDSAWHRLYECDAMADIRDDISPDILACVPHLPQVLSLHGWDLRSPYKLQWLQYLNNMDSFLPTPFLALDGPVVDLFVDGSCFFEVPFKLAAWAVVLGQTPSLQVSAEHFGVFASGWVPGCIQTSHRAELWALLAALSYGVSFSGVLRIWSDCQSVVDNFNLLVKGRKALQPNASHFDLWLEILDQVDKLGASRVFVAKVPAHENLDTAVSDLERWAYLGNALADATAKSTNLDRPEHVWAMWHAYKSSAEKLETVGVAIRKLMVQVSQRWQERQVVASPLASTNRPIFNGRVFPIKWSGYRFIEGVSGVWHRRFHTLEHRFLQWWNLNTATSDEPRWVPFLHLYIDWMMSTGHLGVLKLGKRWYDSELHPGIAAEQYTFRLRVKHWRLCLQQFLKDTGFEVSTATCRTFSRVVQIFVGAISLPWPLSRLQVIDNWIEEQLGSVVRGHPSCLDRLYRPARLLGLDP